MKCDIKNSYETYSDCSYVLDKKICNKYNMVITRINVLELLRNYKEWHAKSLYKVYDYGLTSNMSESISISKKNHQGFSTKVDEMIEEEMKMNRQVEIIEKLKSEFTDLELKYYNYCLQNNYSEENFLRMIGELSKVGLIPIKHSCILKIALAFNIAVLKN